MLARAREHEIAEAPVDESPKGTPAQREPRTGRGGGRRLLGAVIGLAALGGIVALLALPGHGPHGAPPPAHPAALGSVGMPSTLPGDVLVPPLRIAIVLGKGMTPRARKLETRATEAWLRDHVNPRTRVTIIDRVNDTTTGPLSRNRLGRALPRARFRGRLADQLESVYAIGRGERVLVSTGAAVAPTGAGMARLDLVLRADAPLPREVPLRAGATVRRAVDPQLRDATAATVARGVINISGMSEAAGE